MEINDLIDRYIEDLVFDKLIKLADIFCVPHDEKFWMDDEWIDRENELRDTVGDAFKEITT